MPREGISLGQVEEAIKALQQQNRKPSYRNIRDVLGEGSLTTIANHVKELERQRQIEHQPLDGDRPALPDPVMKALYAGAETTWSELLAAADTIVDEHQTSADAQVADAKAIAEQAIEQRDQAEARNHELLKALSAMEDELNTLSKAHDALNADQRDLQQQLSVSHTQCEGLDNLVNELRKTIEQSKVDVANADKRRATLEQQFADAKQEHVDALAFVRQEVSATRNQLQQQTDQAQARIEQLRTSLASRESEIAAVTAERDGERQASKRSRRELEKTLADNVLISKTSDERSLEIAILQERCAALQTAIDKDREQRAEFLATTGARIDEQAAMINTLNAALEREASRKPNIEQ